MDLSDNEKIKFLYEQIRTESDPGKLALLAEELRSLKFERDNQDSL